MSVQINSTLPRELERFSSLKKVSVLLQTISSIYVDEAEIFIDFAQDQNPIFKTKSNSKPSKDHELVKYLLNINEGHSYGIQILVVWGVCFGGGGRKPLLIA